MESSQPIINKVKNRFLPLTEAVANGLEAEAKISDFTEIGVLGSGSFGKVTLMSHKLTKAKYAIKSIDKRNKNNQEGKLYFRREVEIMYKAKHPNIVRLYSHFEDDNYCYFVMEYISKGNLYSILSKQVSKCFDAKTVAILMRDLISSVYYLHSMDPPIVHRDIKPENVLLSDDGRLKLTDFGWSNYMTENEVRVTYCGTPVYLAPEMIKEIGHDMSLDIWCIGVLMFELITGTIPFPGNNMNALADNILRTKILWPKDIDFDAKDLISKILKPDPKDRISLVDMLKHRFFTKNISNLSDCLILPTEEEEPPYLLSVHIPSKSNSKITKSKSSDSQNVKNVDQKNKNINNENTTIVSNNANITNQTGFLSAYSDLSVNIKELYDKLKIDYENLTISYNELVKSKSDISKKIEDFSYKESYFKQEKETLIREIEEKDNEKLILKKNYAELNEKMMEKEKKLLNLSNLINLLKEKNKKDEAEIEHLNEYIDKITSEKDEEIKIYQEKIAELQRNSEGNLDNQITSLRQSISGMNERLSVVTSASSDEGLNEYRRKMESELKETKEFLTSEIDNLRKELVKDREKYITTLKNKDDEIKKLVEEKSTIKNNEAKKYNKLILKYDTLLKEKEIEVENLKAKMSKLDNLIAVNNYKK